MGRSSAQSTIATLTLAGRAWGEVRRLPAFDKKRHTVPERATAAAQAFLAKLCAPMIEDEAEALFQESRRQFGYKRQEISLSVAPGCARLEAKDFVLEIACSLDEGEPSRYYVETEVSRVSSRDLLEAEAFGAAIGYRFDRLRCGLRGRVSVESVIDAAESDESGRMSVQYPSDCASCSLRIEGVEGEIVVDGASLELRFGRLLRAADLLALFDQASEGGAAEFGLRDLFD